MTPAKSPVALATTLALGAFLTLSGSLYAADAASATGSAPAGKTATFAKDVAPILQERCQSFDYIASGRQSILAVIGQNKDLDLLIHSAPVCTQRFANGIRVSRRKTQGGNL